MTITFFRKKSFKERLWKSLNVIVGLVTVANLSLVGALVAPQAADAAGGNPLYAWDRTPNPGWSHGQISGYFELEDIPFQLELDGLTAGVEAQISVQHDFIRGGITGIETFRHPNAPTDEAFITFNADRLPFTMSAATLIPGNPSAKQYTFTFTPTGTTASLYWDALIALGAHNYPGASLDVRFNQPGGDKTVPITTNQILYHALQVTKSDNPDPIQLNATTTYTINAKNNGKTDGGEKNFTVTDTLPAGMTYVNGSANPVPTSVVGQVLTWNFGTVADGVTKVITFQATGVQVGTHTNSVTLSADSATPANDTEPTTVLGQCSLTLTKAVDKQTAQPGDTLTYTLNYANTGTANCTGGGVRIDDVIPANTTFVNGSQTQSNQNDTDGQGIDFGYDHDVFGAANPNGFNGSLLSWDAETVVPGESGTVTYQVTVNALDACTLINIDNTAKIFADQLPNGVTSNQVRTVVATPCNGDLTVNKYFDDNGDGQIDRTNPPGWTWDLVNGAQNNAGGTSLSLPGGTYTVTEDALDGYSAAWTCSNQTSGVGESFGLSLSPEQTVTCSFTNTRDIGSLIVHKNVLNPDGGEVVDLNQFTVQLNGGNDKTIAEGTDASYLNLPTGTYTVAELINLDPNYEFVSYSIDTDVNAAGAQVLVEKDKITELTVTNKQRKATIQIFKDVRDFEGNDVNDATEFEIVWNNGSLNVGELSGTFVEVNPGDYTFTETDNPDYTTVIGEHIVTVGSNEVTSITFVNWQKPATITVHKDVLAWDGSDIADDSGFTVKLSSLYGDVNSAFAEGSPAVFNNLKPGTYTVEEINWDGNAYTRLTGPVQIVIEPNDSETATIYNQQNKEFSWTVDKVDDVDPVQAGDTYTYTIGWSISPNSNTQLVNLAISDPLPPHTSFVSASDGGTEVAGTVTWNLAGPFVPGDSGTVTVTVKVADHVDPTTVTNTATLCATQQPYVNPFSLQALSLLTVDPNFVCENAGETTDIVSDYTVSIDKTDNQSTTTPGASYDYSVTWSVNGNAATTSDITIIDTLPEHVAFVTASDGGVYDSNSRTVTWDLGSLNVPAGDTFTVSVTVDEPLYNATVLHNTVQICDAQQECDTGEDRTTVESAINVTLEKSDNVDPVLAGGQIVYTLDWSVSGNSPIDSLVITDNVPANTSFVSADNGGANVAGVVTWNLGAKNPGDSGSVHFTVNVAVPLYTGTLIENTAEACVEAKNLDPDCDQGDETTTVESSFTVAIDKTDNATTVVPGNQLTYVLSWSVNGTAPIDTLTITDAVPANTSFVSADNGGANVAGMVTWNLGAKNPGDNGTVSFIVNVDSPLANETVISNHADICGTSKGLSVECDDGDDTTTVVSDYTLTIEKTDAPDPVQAGSNLVYTIDWTVSGTAPVTSLVITDAVPANTTFVSASNGGVHDPNTNIVTWDLGAKTPGDNGSVTMTVTVDSPLYNGTQLFNEAEICGAAVNLKEVCESDDETTTVESSFDTTIDKSAPATIDAGALLTYTLDWTVSGNTPIDNLVITDHLPSNLDMASPNVDLDGGTYDLNTNTITWNLGPQTPNAVGTLTVIVPVLSPLADGTTLVNAAEVCAESAEVGIQTSTVLVDCDDDETTTEVNSDFTVSLVKTDNVDPVLAGGTLIYNLAWSTTGNAPIDSLVITDAVPTNTTFVSASNGGVHDPNTNIVTWDLGAKTPGDIGSVTMSVTVASPIANGTIISNVGEVCGQSFTRTQQEVIEKCDDDDETTTVSSIPSLSITKTNNVAGFTNPGKTVTYTVIVTNAANATDTAQNVVMTDVLPAGFTYVDGGASTKNFPLGNLVPGASVTTTYVVNISAAQLAGTYTNTATAKGDNTGSVSATSNVEVRIPQILGDEPEPKLTLTKSVTPTTSNPGKIITYTLVVKNIGEAEAGNVVVTDTLPNGFTFVEGGDQSKSWKLGTLKPNQERVINYEVRIGTNVKAGVYKNVAIVTADGHDPVKATRDVTVKVPQVLGLATTGVGPIDYALFALGLTTLMTGLLWFVRLRRDQDGALA